MKTKEVGIVVRVTNRYNATIDVPINIPADEIPQWIEDNVWMANTDWNGVCQTVDYRFDKILEGE